MAKPRKKKSQTTAIVKRGVYVYCPACASFQMKNGVCRKCGYTLVGKSKKATPDNTVSEDTAK